ncbi:hypothetical protein [Bacteroides caecimuris]|uniref:Uncharacterized protein n=1 Tax=Bacteroides caecimuris TaxID=1796613 RepID=A0A4S2CBW0_9BACE|nr:hypothetical protein [Bacteroides caecimuris]TGY25286.1 hypothetical protein E5353_17620 [Bacteroides caecimuris]
MFLIITYDVRWGGTKSLNDKLVHSVACICDCIQNYEWQQLVNNTVRKNSENQIVLAIVVRLFNTEMITTNNIKSYYKYDRKKNRLNIDIILNLERYIYLSEKETVENISKDIYDYLSIILKKYSSRLVDFNVPIFLSALNEQLKRISHN